MNISIKDLIWKLKRDLTNWQLWTVNYWCPDGDGISLYISKTKDSLELECFSGIGRSKIIIDEIEFSYLSNKIEIDFSKPFELQCLTIADYFCRLFCEYKEKDS